MYLSQTASSVTITAFKTQKKFRVPKRDRNTGGTTLINSHRLLSSFSVNAGPTPQFPPVAPKPVHPCRLRPRTSRPLSESALGLLFFFNAHLQKLPANLPGISCFLLWVHCKRAPAFCQAGFPFSRAVFCGFLLTPGRLIRNRFYFF